MQSFRPLLLTVILCAFVMLAGCENKRYQPAVWSSTTLPGKPDSSPNATPANHSPDNSASTEANQPTDWISMVGKGGQNIKSRSNRLPVAAHHGGTLPTRRGTSLPTRRINGTSLPTRGINGTSLPARGMRGTSLPIRGVTRAKGMTSSTLPARQLRYGNQHQRNQPQSGTTMPVRKGTTLPKR